MIKFYKIITPEEDRYINQYLDNISFQKKKKINFKNKEGKQC